ncbi:MAG: hypothetical protein R3F59_35370 [Myxococcota bacterium]
MTASATAEVAATMAPASILWGVADVQRELRHLLLEPPEVGAGQLDEELGIARIEPLAQARRGVGGELGRPRVVGADRHEHAARLLHRVAHARAPVAPALLDLGEAEAGDQQHRGGAWVGEVGHQGLEHLVRRHLEVAQLHQPPVGHHGQGSRPDERRLGARVGGAVLRVVERRQPDRRQHRRRDRRASLLHQRRSRAEDHVDRLDARLQRPLHRTHRHPPGSRA